MRPTFGQGAAPGRAGADGIITDYPTRLRTVMAALGMPLRPAYHRLK
jgi:glycerophosphoryl diester phosphodiesterase